MIGCSRSANEGAIGARGRAGAERSVNRRLVTEGFRARYLFFCDGASCLNVEYISTHLVFIDSNHNCSSCWKTCVEEMERDPRHQAFVETQPRCLRWQQMRLDRQESSDNVKVAHLANDYHLEIRDRGVRGIWTEEGDEDLFRDERGSF